MRIKQPATFYSLEWKKTGNAEFITRKAKEPKPTSTCKVYKQNEDGSVVYMVTKSNQYILTLKTAAGKLVSEDIFSVIKDAYRIVSHDSAPLSASPRSSVNVSKNSCVLGNSRSKKKPISSLVCTEKTASRLSSGNICDGCRKRGFITSFFVLMSYFSYKILPYKWYHFI